MDAGYKEFDARLRSLDRKKAAIMDGARPELGENGVVELKPTHNYLRNIGRLLPLRAVMIMATIGVAYKGFLLASLGAVTYSQKVSILNAGGGFDRIGAWLMQIDPVTEKISEVFVPFIG